jgi:hypothetical protein
VTGYDFDDQYEEDDEDDEDEDDEDDEDAVYSSASLEVDSGNIIYICVKVNMDTRR